MAEHTAVAVLNLLKSWREAICTQVKALQEGNIETLEGFMQQSSKIQLHLQEIFKTSPRVLRDRQIAGLLRELHQDQGSIIEYLKGQTDELAREIATLRRNRTSLGGYKKKKDPSPRFMSKRT